MVEEAEGNEGRCPEGLVRELIRCIDERKTPLSGKCSQMKTGLPLLIG